jgi:hypothetical protein
MGGYWAVRAAGRERRINRVVAWPPVFDWLYRLPMVTRGPVRTMLRRRRLMRWCVRTRARLIPTLRQIVDHTLYLVDGHDPIEVVDWFLGMNADQHSQPLPASRFACSRNPRTLINTARSATSASPVACWRRGCATPARNRPAWARSRHQVFVEDICSRIPTALATPSSNHNCSETAHARRR